MAAAAAQPSTTTSRGGGGMLAFLAWRNLWRNPVRSALTAGAMVVGLTMMIVTGALTEGMFRRMAFTVTELNVGHLQLHRQAYIDDQDLYAVLPWALVEHLERTTGHTYAPRLYAAGLASSGEFSTGVMLKGIDPALEAKVTTLHRHLRAGKFSLGAVPPAPGRPQAFTVYDVVIGAQLAKTLKAEIGAELVLITQAADGSIGNGLFRVAGVLKPVEGTIDRAGVFLSLEAYQSLMALEGGVHELAALGEDLIKLDGDQAAIQAAVTGWPGVLPDQKESGPVVVRQWTEINPTVAHMLGLSNVYVTIITLIIFTLVALGLANTVLMSIHERTREFGMLLAMGMGRLRLLTMVLLESFFLAVSAGALGALLGILWSLRLETHGLDFSSYLPGGMDFAGVTIELKYNAFLSPAHVWIAVVVMLVTTMLATLVPSLRTVRLRPAAAMHG